MKKVGIVLVVIAMILGIGFYRSYYRIDVTTEYIESDKIDQDVNIVMISDVHDKHCKVKDQIISKIKELEPDLILCVGDIIDDTSTSDEDTLSFMAKLIEIAPVYYSLGNHEETFYKDHEEDLEKYNEIGVHLLEEEYEDIVVNEQNIRIGGVYNYCFSTYSGNITKSAMHNSSTYQFLSDFVDTDSFKLMMAHRPDSFIFGQAENWDLDLLCSGHYHGGQVILPFIGGLYAPELGWMPKYSYGVYQLSKFKMVLTRGVSSSIEKLPRFNNPCEIMQIILQ